MSSRFSTDLIKKTLQAQIAAVVVIAIIALIGFGQNAGVSALLGGITVLIGTWLGTIITESGANIKTGSAALLNLLKAEAIKIGTIIILLWLIFKFYGSLVPLALIAGLAASALFSAIALSKIKI